MPAAPDPPFVCLPGDVVGSPPYLSRGCLTQAMILQGDREAQQAFVDLALNRPAAGVLSFRAVTDKVLLTAIYSATLGSTVPPDDAKGVIQEWDVGFWTAVHGGRLGQEGDWRTYWLPSYLFVDTPAAMASGREIYGYPKTTADFKDRVADDADPSVTLEVLHFPVFARDARPRIEPLVRIARGAPAAGAVPGFVDQVRAAWDLLGELVDPLPAGHIGFGMPPLPNLSMPQIMLRQVRDPTIAGRAALQSVLTVAPSPVRIDGFGPLAGPVHVDLAQSASHPIADTLGLAPSQAVQLGFWLRQDFEVGLAQLLD